MSDEEILDATGASFHPTSTCAIGAESDPMAVATLIVACMVFRDCALPMPR